MMSKQATVRNPSGIHARPASLFVKKASDFESAVTIRNASKGGEPRDAKSILSVMSIGAACGCEIEIAADGPDAPSAVDALIEFIESGCGE